MGKFDKYKIDLKGMQSDSVKYEFVLDNLYFAHIDGPEVQKGKVNVELTVKRTSRAFELSFQTDGVVWVPCDRCLDEMEQPVSSSDKLMVKFGHEYAEEGDNLIVIPEEEGEINVAWFMYEFIALSICPNCGEWHVYHTVCGACGYYRGKLAIEKEAAV